MLLAYAQWLYAYTQVLYLEPSMKILFLLESVVKVCIKDWSFVFLSN